MLPSVKARNSLGVGGSLPMILGRDEPAEVRLGADALCLGPPTLASLCRYKALIVCASIYFKLNTPESRP